MNAENDDIGYWKIAAGEGGYIWPEQRDFEVTSVGWPKIGSLKKYRNNDDAGIPKQLWMFFQTVKKLSFCSAG